MDSKRREEIRERSLTIGRGTDEITENELRALLARDEAADQCAEIADELEFYATGLREFWGEQAPSVPKSKAMRVAGEDEAIAARIKKALGRD